MSRLLGLAAAILLLVPAIVWAQAIDQRSAEMYGELRLIDEIIAGQEKPHHHFEESEPGISEVRQILGRPTRVLPNTDDKSKVMYFRLGEGMGLQSQKFYLLQVEYPEDAPRSFFIHNLACETTRGLATGRTVGDVLHGKYTNSNSESINYPLSGQHEPFQMLFVMQDKFSSREQARGSDAPRDKTPEYGIPVMLSMWKSSNSPLSEGVAFSRIALYEVVDPSKLVAKINYPPEGLPRRHLFWREEMSDGVVNATDPGWNNDVDWYEAKAKMMLFLGMNTYTIDMLEFGHNQGWDSEPGGLDWVNASHAPKRWENVLRRLREKNYPFTMLPYYEYAGSVGKNSPGTKKFARPLGDESAYTHITWSEKAYADVTEPIILEDAKKVLDLTITRWKEIMPFTGAWFRTRPSHMPMSFSDNAIAKFSREANDGVPVTREELRKRGETYHRYIKWWNGQRKQFLFALRDHLREKVTDDALIMFTWDASEPGVPLLGPGPKVVTDDLEFWNRLNREQNLRVVPISLKEVLDKKLYLQALLAPHPTWGQWEWEHSLPAPDPDNYANEEGVILTYPFNRLYTVGSSEQMEPFRTKSGLAVVRHYSLNENEIERPLVGYFAFDVDRTRAHMMQAEVLAVAYGDPWYLGYLSGHNFTRGFPYYARRFNQAYLSLPALPSEIVPDAASDPEVIVRSIKTEQHGTWFAIANTSIHPKEEVTVKLPEGKVTDAATGESLNVAGGVLRLNMDAAELRSIRVE